MKSTDPAQQQEERILNHILKIIALVGLVALIPSLILSFRERLWSIGILDLVLYLIALLLAFTKGIPFRVKTVYLISSTYLLGAALLILTGPFGAGIIYQFAFILLTALFFSTRSTFAANLLSITTLLIFGLLDYTGILIWKQGMESILVIISNFILISTLLSYGISFLMNSMRYRIKEETRLREELNSLLAEKELLLKELNHRVRNSIQQIMSLIQLRIRRTESPDSKDALRDIENRMGAISQMYELLYRSDYSDHIPVPRYLDLLVDSTRKSLTELTDDVIFRIDVEDLSLSIEQLTPCGLIINEVLTNAFKHAFPPDFDGEKRISITFRKQNQSVQLSIKDNGIGKPPDTAVSSHSLGRKLLTTLVEVQLEGSLKEIYREGTEIVIEFPVR